MDAGETRPVCESFPMCVADDGHGTAVEAREARDHGRVVGERAIAVDLERAADPEVDQVPRGEADVGLVGGDARPRQAVAQRGSVRGLVDLDPHHRLPEQGHLVGGRLPPRAPIPRALRVVVLRRGQCDAVHGQVRRVEARVARAYPSAAVSASLRDFVRSARALALAVASTSRCAACRKTARPWR